MRAARVDQRVVVAGTTATGPDGRLGGGADPHRQTVQALDNIAAALGDAGALMGDVIRTRIYVTRREEAEPVMRALGAARHVRPAATLVLVSDLIDAAMLVEIEADAVVDLAESEP